MTGYGVYLQDTYGHFGGMYALAFGAGLTALRGVSARQENTITGEH